MIFAIYDPMPPEKNQTMRTTVALLSAALLCLGSFLFIPSIRVNAQPQKEIVWETFNEVSIPVPPGEHPRVFLRTRDIPDLKRRVEHPVLKPVWEEMQQLAEKNPQIRIEVNAARYLMTNDKKLGRETLALALKTLQEATYDLTAQDVTRPIGRMMVTGAIAYDWCYPVLTPEQKNAFQAEFLRLAQQLECGYPPKRMGWVTGHGSEWMVMRDMLSAGLAIFDENPDMYRHAAHTFFAYLLPARNWWYPGHAFHQGTAYSETRFSSDLYPLWIFERLGVGNVYHPAQQFVPYQWIYIRRPDGQLMRAGDGQSRDPKLRSLLSASYYKDGYVLADYLKNPGIDAMNKIFQLLWSDPDLQPLPETDLPLTRYMGFPYGWMVARTGWDEHAVIAEMKVNIYNFNNHQHMDAGAFQIYHRGPLAIDSGTYSGKKGAYSSPHSKNYNWRTIAHNSLLVYDPDEVFGTRGDYGNDGGQRLPNDRREPATLSILQDPANRYVTGKVLAQGFGPDIQAPDYSYLKGDITQAYSAKVTEVKRTFTFLNLKNSKVPAALIVFDRVISANPEHKKFWLMHSMEEPKTDGNVTSIILSKRGWTGMLVNTTLLPEPGNTELNVIGGPGKEFWVFGVNYDNEPTTGDVPANEVGEWRVEISPKTPSPADNFLNVMQMMDKSNPQALQVRRIDGEQCVGVQIADRVVIFNRNADIKGTPFTFSIHGEGEYKILVTDLLPGTWQVRKEGKVVHPGLPAREDDGLIYFTGTAGNYTLLR